MGKFILMLIRVKETPDIPREYILSLSGLQGDRGRAIAGKING